MRQKKVGKEQSIDILNISIDNLTREELLSSLRMGGVVFTPNFDHLIKLQESYAFYKAYSCATYRVCDSQVLMFLSKLMGTPIREKITGSDLLPAFCQYYRDEKEIKVFLLGAAEGVAKQAQKNINRAVGREMVVGTYSPSMGFDVNDLECQFVIDLINTSGATALVVGLGAPKQEIWIQRYKSKLPKVTIYLSVGAAIDFAAGRQKRAPKWVSNGGLEWLYRITQEPKRLWKRYFIDDLPVLILILLQRLNLYRSPFKTQKVNMLIGSLLEQSGLLTEEQIEEVLLIQKENKHLSFGEIVTRFGWLRQETIDFLTETYPKILAQPERKRLPLGYYLLTAKLLTEQQVTRILIEQGQTNEFFGQIAVRREWLSKKTVNFFLYTLKNSRNLNQSELISENPQDQEGEVKQLRHNPEAEEVVSIPGLRVLNGRV